MKVIQGLKQLKVVEKRMEANRKRIEDYASMVSTERPLFESEDTQKKEIMALVQANMDLGVEYRELKKQVDRTNLTIEVTVGKDTYTIADLLILRRSLAKTMINTYKALNDNTGQIRLRNFTSRVTEGKTPTVVRLYDEKVKNAGMKEWIDLLDEIEMRLEVINATTDLVD